MLSFPTLAGRFPFRLGATSFIVPADMETNVHFLASKVDDVLVLRAQLVDTLGGTLARETDPARVCIENPLSYPAFHDLAGTVNQAAARIADRVIFMVSVIPLFIRGSDK
jgi:hypothetical protein